MRWSRWSSNLEELDPSLATLQCENFSDRAWQTMLISHSILYHTARISLNRPRIIHKDLKDWSCQQSDLLPEAMKICDASIEIIVSVLRRFDAQHSLKNAPLSFVHGVIAAADATVALASTRRKDDEMRLLNGDSLGALAAALGELPYAWEIAAEAREELQNLLDG